MLPSLAPGRAYLRVKLQRQVARLGAAQLKPGVYVLPFSAENTEKAEQLRAELVAEGGNLIVWAAVLCAGLSDEELSDLFNP